MILAYALLTIFAFVRLGYCLTCANGGQVVALGCTNSLQCAPYTRAPVACISSQCCTVSFNYKDSQFTCNQCNDVPNDDNFTVTS